MTDQKQRKAVKLSDYEPPAFEVETVDLHFQLTEDCARVRTRMHLHRADGVDLHEPLHLHGEALELEALYLDGQPLAMDDFLLTRQGLSIERVPDRFELEVHTLLRPQDNTSLSGLYRSGGNFCTQCEAEGFRRITYFPDRPDVLSRFTTTIEADRQRYPVLLSNGDLVDSGDAGEGRHWVKWVDPWPKPSYLFALVAGDLHCHQDTYHTRSGRDVQLEFYVEHENANRTGHAMESLKKAMRWDEDTYGLEYDLDTYMVVAVGDFNMGAMENKGLNIFNTQYVLASPETATDADFEAVEAVIGHEYFHNYTGNRVTCRDWFQLTLKEGLTVFRDQQFTADMHSEAVKRIGDVSLLREGQFLEDAGPLAHPIRPAEYMEINNFYTRTVYEKGAEVIRMIHTLIGEDAFRRGMDLYFERHDGAAVTCEDFVACMAAASGRDFGQFMRWYNQAGTPVLEVEDSFDADTRRYTLSITQSTPASPGQPEKLPFVIPIRMGLIDRPSGAPLPLRLEGENAAKGTERVLELTETRQSFTFEDIDSPPLPSLLRGFSAPVKLETTLGRGDLAAMLAHDLDTFNRWEAGQRLLLDLMRELLRDHQSGRAMTLDPSLAPALRTVLDDSARDPAFAARVLTLPSRSLFAQGLRVIDVEGVDAVARFMRKELGHLLRDNWLAILEAAGEPHLEAPTSGAPSTDAMARRSLKNTALAYLVWSGLEAAAALAATQYTTARNMTDRMAALRALADVQAAGYEDLLADFYRRFENEPLVVNKWFALQALIEDDGSVERVGRLMHHPAFTLSNPNRVRALVGMFATGNLTGFHRPDGAGYRLLADVALELDRKNPQIASRLLLPLGRWRRYDTNRQTLMHGQLERIGETAGLSKDAYEVVSKSLRS